MNSFYKYLIFFLIGIILSLYLKKDLVEGYTCDHGNGNSSRCDGGHPDSDIVPVESCGDRGGPTGCTYAHNFMSANCTQATTHDKVFISTCGDYT